MYSNILLLLLAINYTIFKITSI